MKHSDFVESMEKEHAEWKNKRLFLLNWIDDVLFNGENLFSYRPTYVLIRPHLIIREIASEIKWAYQRVVRGWDDRVVWSVDVWLNDIMPNILVKLKEDKVGVPNKFFKDMVFDENHGYTDEQVQQAKELWNNELDKMIAGFFAAEQLNKLEYDYMDKNKEAELLHVFKEGLNSFRDNYFYLWD